MRSHVARDGARACRAEIARVLAALAERRVDARDLGYEDGGACPSFMPGLLFWSGPHAVFAWSPPRSAWVQLKS